jgi:uncharacterized protein YndB with AHSA1/START domain
MAKEARVKVVSSHRYNVPAEEVYDTLLDPKKAAKFMFATFTGKMIKAEIDPHVGGQFLFVDRREGGDAAHYGEYTRLERPHHIAFRFAVQKNAAESDPVSIDIKPLNKGCEVTLTHEVKEEYAHLEDRIQEGWDGILDGLGAALRKA